MSYSVSIWKATHEGGSKFYQTFLISDGSASFHLFHWGSLNVDSGFGKITAGQVQVGHIQSIVGAFDEVFDKKTLKRKACYRLDSREVVFAFDTKAGLQNWVRQNIAAKWAGSAQRNIQSFTNTAESVVQETALVPVKAEPETPLSERQEEWGSW